jgi:hypothetical protein
VQVAGLLRVSTQSVYQWRREYRAGGEAALAAKGPGGNACKLDDGLACLKTGEPGRFLYRIRVHRRRKGERRSMSEADYAELITAAHRTLAAPSS